MHSTSPTDRRTLAQEGFPIVRDLMRPRPLVYWSDYLFCTALGWASFLLAGSSRLGLGVRALSFVVAACCLYRSVLFIHEIVHLKKDDLPFFRTCWNWLTGFPLLVPAYFYDTVHLMHHRKNRYGTTQDGEYLPFATKGRGFILIFLAGNLFFPLVLVFRHLILTPLSAISPSIRRWTWAHLSSLEIDFSYVRPEPSAGRMPFVEQALPFAVAAAFALAVATGILSAWWLWQWFAMAGFVLILNAVRTLVAHRYRHSGDEPIDAEEQFLDSIDIPGNPFTAIWAPVGLRYHATHHLFPGIPYHHLRLAHERLEAGLSENAALYRRATRGSLWIAFRELWGTAGKARVLRVAEA